MPWDIYGVLPERGVVVRFFALNPGSILVCASLNLKPNSWI